jgi:nucleotide-binding universal stress UspA family protein
MTPHSLIVSIDAIPKEQLRRLRVLVRIDPRDEVKLNDGVPTLVFLSQSGARIVVATHSPVEDLFTLLSRLVGRPVSILDEWKGDAGLRTIAHLLDGEITMIKDLALEPGEEAEGLISHRQLTAEGDPAKEIVKCAAEMHADLIAMGSQGESGVRSLVMGSVSRKVTNHARQPVLIVRAQHEGMLSQEAA